MSIHFTPSYKDGRLFFETEADKKGIKTNSFLQAVIKNIFKKIGIGKGTLTVKSPDSNQSWKLNKNSAIKWIKNNNSDIKQLEKLDNNSLIEKIAFICARKLATHEDKESLVKALGYFKKEANQADNEEIQNFLKMVVEKLAEMKDPEALAMLGNFYAQGTHGYTQSDESALKYLTQVMEKEGDEAKKLAIPGLQKLAEKKVPTALKMMGQFYIEGDYGVEKSEAKALEYLTEALKAEDTPLQKSVAQDIEKLANTGNIEATLILGQFYQKKEFNLKAIKFFKQAAEKDNIEAQYRLAQSYLDEEDLKNASYWLSKAAQSGHILAQHELGSSYEEKKDFANAFQWFLKAAKQGHSKSQVKIGGMYYEGHGVEQNYPMAEKYFLEVTKKEDSLSPQDKSSVQKAFHHLGIMHEEGSSTTPSLENAYACYEKGGHNSLLKAIEVALPIGKTALLNGDLAKAHQFLSVAVRNGNPEAEYYMGLLFFKKHDFKQSISFLKKATEKNQLDAQYLLGRILLQGEQPRAALKLFLKAAKSNHVPSKFYVGKLLLRTKSNIDSLRWFLEFEKESENLEGSDQNLRGEAQFLIANIYESRPSTQSQAIEWYQKAAESKYARAEYKLGLLHELGFEGLEKSEALAFEWYAKSAGQGYHRAIYSMGRIYEHGINGQEHSYNKAYRFYQLAAAAGNPDALNILKNLEAWIRQGLLQSKKVFLESMQITDENISFKQLNRIYKTKNLQNHPDRKKNTDTQQMSDINQARDLFVKKINTLLRLAKNPESFKDEGEVDSEGKLVFSDEPFGGKLLDMADRALQGLPIE